MLFVHNEKSLSFHRVMISCDLKIVWTIVNHKFYSIVSRIVDRYTSKCSAAEKGSVNYEKILLMKCTKSINDMVAPCITHWIQNSIIHHTAVHSAG